MNKQWNKVERLIFLSISFTILLITFRLLYFGQVQFIFLVWNLFLAVVPLMISRRLYLYSAINFKVIALLTCWWLFLPNAPYIMTDLFHLKQRPPVPKWFDLLLITSAAWNGLMLGIISLLRVEQFLKAYLSPKKVNAVMLGSIFASAFGIYVGRFLRFNSWDVITNGRIVLRELGYRFVYPQNHPRTWAFTALFSVMLALVYYTIKRIISISDTSIKTI